MKYVTTKQAKCLQCQVDIQYESGVTNSPDSPVLPPPHPVRLSFPYFPGLEAFSSHPLVLSSLDKLAVGKILLMEALEPCQQGEMPVVVLYDTSQDDDVNINSTCLKALQDKTMNNPLTVKNGANYMYSVMHV